MLFLVKILILAYKAFSVVMLAVFVPAFVLLLCSKKDDGIFLEYVPYSGESRSSCAHYDIGGEEYKNIFPASAIFKTAFYPQNTKVKLRVINRFKLTIDKAARITIYIGTVFSISYFIFAILIPKV